MGRIGKRMNNSLASRNKSKKKQKAKFANTDITNQDLRELLNKFENSPYLSYKHKQVHNEPTESSFFLIKLITKRIKINGHVQIHTKGVK